MRVPRVEGETDNPWQHPKTEEARNLRLSAHSVRGADNIRPWTSPSSTMVQGIAAHSHRRMPYAAYDISYARRHMPQMSSSLSVEGCDLHLPRGGPGPPSCALCSSADSPRNCLTGQEKRGRQLACDAAGKHTRRGRAMHRRVIRLLCSARMIAHMYRFMPT